MEIVCSLRADLLAPGEARRALRPLQERVPGWAFDDVQIVVSELVANSVLHAGGGEESVVVECTVSPERVHVEVIDRGDGFEPEIAPTPRQDLQSGHGLFLVDRLADRWGVRTKEGATVWAEIDLARRAGRPA